MPGKARHIVLVTRPEPGLSDTLARVAALGWEPGSSPMLDIRARDLRVAAFQFDHVLLSSGQAIPALSAALASDASVLAVGAITAQRARDAGFSNVQAASGDAESLLALLGTAPKGGRVLLPTAQGQGARLAEGARRQGWRVIRRVAYEARPLTVLTPKVMEVLQNDIVSAVLFFSAATARAFMVATGLACRSHLRCARAIVLSAQVGAALDPAEWRSIEIAPRPEQAALLRVLGHIPVVE